jgi:ribA/ribD-fused uncharacterized protein
VVDGVTYPTAEHWMMVCKAKVCGDLAIVDEMLAEPDPAEVKKLGRKVKNYDEKLWTEKRFECVVVGNVHKFSQYPEMKEWLLNTGDKVLVEASPYDWIWGIGLAENHKDAWHPGTWRGQNLLGFSLMEVRDRFRATLENT